MKSKNCVLYFHFSYLYFFLAGNIIVYPPSQSTNREKYFRLQHIKVKKCRLRREINNFSIHLFHHRTRFSIFRQKIDGPNPSEMDIKVSIPAPTSCLLYTPKMESSKNFLVYESKLKL